MNWLAGFFAVLALIGLAQAVAGWVLVRRFAEAPRPEPARPPAVSVLKPLHGDEPLLEAALASLCAQNYPVFQIVFGVRDADDPTLAVVARLRASFPACDIAVVVDATPHGSNRKIENLMNMLPAATHDVLVIADSDVHVEDRYLRRLVGALEGRDVGLVTTLYVGLPAWQRSPAWLGAGGINWFFLPGALLARAMGRQDCLGATMALRRETLARIGGLEALVDHLADDNRLGQLVRAQGFEVALAPTVPATTVGEDSLDSLFRHELRWARTIRALEPLGFAASVLQYKLVWAAFSLVAAPGFSTLALFALIWLGGALAARGIEQALAPLLKGLAFAAPVWLLPLRELFSVVVMAASYAGDRVEWRGHWLRAKPPATEKTGP